MSVICGKTYLLYDNESPDQLIGKVRDLSISVSGEIVDISNKDSDNWREILTNCNQKTVTISASGLLDRADVGQTTLRTLMLSGATNAFRIEEATGYWSGDFVVTSYDEGSTYNDAVTFSVTLENSGAVSYTTS